MDMQSQCPTSQELTAETRLLGDVRVRLGKALQTGEIVVWCHMAKARFPGGSAYVITNKRAIVLADVGFLGPRQYGPQVVSFSPAELAARRVILHRKSRGDIVFLERRFVESADWVESVAIAFASVPNVMAVDSMLATLIENATRRGCCGEVASDEVRCEALGLDPERLVGNDSSAIPGPNLKRRRRLNGSETV
jgi:hypothetical protein